MNQNDYLRRKFGQIVLASSSPRRAQILAQVGFDFVVEPSHVDETLQGDNPVLEARRLALDKALPVANRWPDRIVLAADTIVLIDDSVLGKPVDAGAAREMLEMLSGRTHEVHTAYALLHRAKDTTHIGVEMTRVTFRKLNSDDIDRYIATGAPFDKAGSYGIQDASAVFVESIEGDFYNVVGLPITNVYQALNAHFQIQAQ